MTRFECNLKVLKNIYLIILTNFRIQGLLIGYLCNRGDEFRPKKPCEVSRPSRTRGANEWPQYINAIYDNGEIGTLTYT